MTSAAAGLGIRDVTKGIDGILASVDRRRRLGDRRLEQPPQSVLPGQPLVWAY